MSHSIFPHDTLELRRVMAWVLIAATLVPNRLIAASIASPGLGATLTVLESSEEQVLLQLSIDNYQVERAHKPDGYAHIVIAGTTQSATPQYPQVPTLGVLVGLPTVEEVSLTVLEATSSQLENIHLPIVEPPEHGVSPSHEASASVLEENLQADPTVLVEDHFVPQEPVTLGQVGYLRHQAVAQVQFHPVLYNPARSQATLYSHLLIRLTWKRLFPYAADTRQQPQSDFDAFLPQLLINPATSATAQQTKEPTLFASSWLADFPHFDKPALKIKVERAGIYKLTNSDLQNAGFMLDGVDPRTLQLFQPEGEVAIVVNGEEDGHFDSHDSLLFYGVSAPSRYSDINVYWLAWGNGLGRRISQRDGTPSLDRLPEQQFVTTQHAEENTVYWQTMIGQGEDRWFWGRRLSPNTTGLDTSRSYPIPLQQVVTDGSAILRLRLRGFSGQEHHTRIYLNDQLVDDHQWYGQVPFIHVASVTQSFLHNGENQVRVETVASAAAVDQLLVDWIELDYARHFTTESDELAFTVAKSGTQQFALAGFSTASNLLFDISDPIAPVQISGTKVEAGNGTFTLRFEEVASFGANYVALATAGTSAPAALELDQPSNWRTSNNGADYIIITHEDFYSSALQLAAHRQNQGLRTAVAKIGDIYDEFSAGRFRPQAIRDFLTYTFRNWQAPSPTYVLLIGDASQDYKDSMQTATPNYVPSQNIDTSFGEVSSDQWFATVQGDDPLPDLLIGRLAVQSPAEAATVVEKLIAYDQQPGEEAWNSQLLFVADDDEASFRAFSEQLISQLPSTLSVQTLFAETYPPGNMTIDLVNALNQGQSLVNYVGHGSYLGWGQWDANRQQIFDTSTAAALQNGGRLPFVVVANCLNGFFAGPKESVSLAEVLQRHPGGGAIAIWAPSGFEYAVGHQILLDKLYSALFAKQQSRLGLVINAAKIATYEEDSYWQELNATYLLFGDPATSLKIPGLYANRSYFPIVAR